LEKQNIVKKHTKQFLLTSALLTLIILSIPMKTYAEEQLQRTTQIYHEAKKFGNSGLTGGLVQTVIPQAKVSTKLQSQNQNGSLGSSGITTNTKKVFGASINTLPSLWNPLNPNSGNYNQTTPVLDQQDLSICWDYSGVDAIGLGAQVTGIFNPAPLMVPAYYDYLSATNAFLPPATNNLAITIPDVTGTFVPRQLGDANTLDYVPSMSILGYDPALANSDFPQLINISQDIPKDKTSFDALQKAGLHVSDTYKLPGLLTEQFPTTVLDAMNRVEQIKQMIYNYGAVQYGPYAEYTLDTTLASDNTAQSKFVQKLSEQSISNGDYTSYTPYSAATSVNTAYSNDSSWYPALTTNIGNNQDLVNGNHEMEIVGYDDNYPASNFKQTPTIGGETINGAFLVKNSWGTSTANFSKSGYFYVSYADVFLQGSDILADKVEVTKNQKIYSATNTSPDASGYVLPFGGTGLPIPSDNNDLFTNTYTSQSIGSGQVEQLSEISMALSQPNVNVNLYYKVGDVTSSSQLSDFKKLGSYTFTNAGYQTIPVPPVSVPENTDYTIAYQITNLSGFSTFSIPIQTHSDSTTPYPVLTSNNSQVEVSGNWTNLSASAGINLYLDAHTQTVPAYILSFDTAGGSSVASQTIGSGTNAVLPTSPTRSGYTFTGWMLNGGAYDFSTAVSQDMTLTANWTKNPPAPVVKPTPIPAISIFSVYRLYNPNTGEHFYTTSSAEKNFDVKAGWNYEGVGWTAPTTGTPIYRVFNPNAKGGDHYYTKSKAEATSLVAAGWKWDNGGKPVFYSGGSRKVYVAYNPHAQSGAHNYTANITEQNNLLSLGWKYGAVAWNAE
jgi:uncharacterized repeat protein (TIGR02543 family)